MKRNTVRVNRPKEYVCLGCGNRAFIVRGNPAKCVDCGKEMNLRSTLRESQRQLLMAIWADGEAMVAENPECDVVPKPTLQLHPDFASHFPHAKIFLDK